jgi:hypothetical protein
LIVNVIGDLNVYTKVGMAKEHLDHLKKFKSMQLQSIIKSYRPKLIKYTNQSYIDTFKKDIQWPHLPLVFVDENRGSCVDLMLFHLMMYEKNKVKYNFGIYPGSNTLLSHVEVMEINESRKSNKTLLFVIFTLYHIFRALQVCRYALYDKQKESLILNCANTIVTRLIPNVLMQKRILKFLIVRSNDTYDRCIKLHKKKDFAHPIGKIYSRVPKKIKNSVVNILKNGFPEGIGYKNSKNIRDFIFDRKEVKNLLYYSPQGVCVFRLIRGYDIKRLTQKYKIKDISGLYVSYIIKTDKTVAGFAGIVFTKLKATFKTNIYLETNKTNKRAITSYEALGFKRIGSSPKQHLYIHVGTLS